MASKFVDLEEAARLLGVTPEEVNTYRERGELHPLRDGATSKFRVDEIERLIADRASGIGGSDELLDAPLELTEDPDSILLSEVELGNSSDTTSSTIIGKDKKKRPSDSDIQIGKGPPPLKKGGSEIGLAGGSDLKLGPSDSSKAFEDDLSLAFDAAGASDLNLAGNSGKKAGASDISLEEPRQPGSTNKGKKKAASSDINLSDDDDLVLGGSGSDVTLGTGDSGIGLGKPSDSGLSLEQPLDLAGSNIEMMELGEDDVVSLEEEADLDSATQLKADDEFLLTPLADGGMEDSSDSGSQVIALEGDDDFSSAGATMINQPGMLVEDMGGMGGFGTAAMTGAMPGQQMVFAPAVPEAAFSIWNIVAFFMTTIVLCFCGMMIYDLMRNMWSWDEPYKVNSYMMDAILKWFEK